MRTRLVKGLPLIHGDRVQLQQVNPIINAVGAMGGRRMKIHHAGTVANVTDLLFIANGSWVNGIPGSETPMRHQGQSSDTEHLGSDRAVRERCGGLRPLWCCAGFALTSLRPMRYSGRT
jgi:hypothetical protein